MTLGKIARISTTVVKMMNQATANACRAEPDRAKTKTVLLVKHIDNCVKSSFSVVANAENHDEMIDCIVDGFDEKFPSLKRDSSGTKEKESAIHKPDVTPGDMNRNSVFDNNDADVDVADGWNDDLPVARSIPRTIDRTKLEPGGNHSQYQTSSAYKIECEFRTIDLFSDSFRSALTAPIKPSNIPLQIDMPQTSMTMKEKCSTIAQSDKTELNTIVLLMFCLQNAFVITVTILRHL